MLRGGELRAPLLAALANVDRLVLLGDVLELRHGPVRDCLAVAGPVLGAIGEALGAGREVVIVPGNHDHHLLGGWLERRSRDGPPSPLELETAVPWSADDTLAMVARLLGPDLGRSSHGASAQAWRALDGAGGARRWSRRLRRRAIVVAFPALVAAMNRARIGPLRADVSGPELRRAGLRSFGEVLSRLRIDATQVVFGHTHRAGPLPADDRVEWQAPTAAALLNTGCWVHEPGFLGERPEESPYRAGFCVRLTNDAPAVLENLLD